MSNIENDLIIKKIFELSGSTQIEAYVHPVRIKIVKMLAKKKRTVSSVAKEFNVHPANITHHFKLLEKAGLISIVERRDNGRNIEKYYRAVSYYYIVKPDKKLNKSALALTILRNDLTTVIESVGESSKVIGLLKTAKILPEDINFFMRELKELVKKFENKNSDNGIQYNLNMSLYPADIDIVMENESIIID